MSKLKVLITIAILLIVVGGIGSVFSYRIVANTDTESVQKEEVNGENIVNIELDVNNEQVEIIPTLGEMITIELADNGSNSDTELIIEKNADTLNIQTSNNYKLFSFNIFNWTRHLKVYVPNKMYHSLNIEIGNGGIVMNDLSINDLYAETSNGEIDIADVEAKHSEMRTNNGKIKLKNINTETIQLSTNNGKIEMEQIDGTIIGKTDNGAISLVTDNLDRSIELQSHNGSINVKTDNEPTNVTFDTNVHNGKINLFNDPNWPSVIGNGDHLIKLSTHNGSITVNE
ncbi:DUF4097 family beta strand repeat-containing protein [Gracilibacillus xinjiangensis]|uniref:DUF4097 domain-containing protein n=1 Tax=Gracilibacillus xinjiangensis TaxID=1193282 RepID=A0ABV8WR61_9BACI